MTAVAALVNLLANLLLTVACVGLVCVAWSAACECFERAARRRCCTGTPSTHWLADRCDECGRRHPSRRTA